MCWQTCGVCGVYLYYLAPHSLSFVCVYLFLTKKKKSFKLIKSENYGMKYQYNVSIKWNHRKKEEEEVKIEI